MNIIAPTDLNQFHHSWITIGSFDGVHLGHQALVKKLADQAHASGEPAIVITFWPHPATFFKRAPLGYALTSPEERQALLLGLGVDKVFTLTFNQALADLSADQFMLNLKENFDLKTLMVGPNFALGKGREGTLEKLAEISQRIGFTLEITQPINTTEGMVSSSQVRTDLREHRVREANQKLGRLYTLSGMVVHGEHRGTGLGIPTANLEVMPERLIPGNGVYVTRALVNGKVYASVTNIGVRPTFENPLPVPRIEPHILDMQDQLYQQQLSLEFIEFLRPEIKFDNSQQLVEQIQKDIARTRQILR